MLSILLCIASLAPTAQQPLRATDARWRAIATQGAAGGRVGETSVLCGREILVFGGLDARDVRLGDGAAYDVTLDGWRPIATGGAPGPRAYHTAVWTGEEMIVWGGNSPNAECKDGGAYDPARRRWRALSTTNAPAARGSHTAIWTGTQMFVWAGVDEQAAFPHGGLYDPRLDRWSPRHLPTDGRVPRTLTAVWTGDLMIAWGGINGGATLGHGIFSSLLRDESSALAAAGAPSPRAYHSTVWTGAEMFVWGGSRSINGGNPLGDGAAYDPVRNVWRELQGGGPTPRFAEATAWSGTEMIVVGGATRRVGDALADVWALHPRRGWRRLPDLPEPRAFSSTFVVDGEVFVLGGRDDADLRPGGFRLKL